MVDTEPGGSRDGNHVSERHIALWYHVIRQEITELCRKGKETEDLKCKITRAQLVLLT